MDPQVLLERREFVNCHATVPSVERYRAHGYRASDRRPNMLGCGPRRPAPSHELMPRAQTMTPRQTALTAQIFETKPRRRELLSRSAELVTWFYCRLSVAR